MDGEMYGMDHQDSNDKQGIAPVTLFDFTLYCCLYLLVTACTCRQFCCRKSYRSLTTQQIFHIYLQSFITCRWIRSWFSISDTGGTPIWFFFSRSALYLFTLSFGVIIIFFAIEVSFATRKTIVMSWAFLIILTILCELFVISGSIYYAFVPKRFQSGSIFYDMSIDLSTGLCLIAGIGNLVVGLITAQKFKKAQIQRYRRAYYKMMFVTLLTTAMMVGRFAMFLYRPITGEYLNEWLFNTFAYWLPEVTLCFCYLYIMRGRGNAGEGGARETAPLTSRRTQNLKPSQRVPSQVVLNSDHIVFLPGEGGSESDQEDIYEFQYR